ncbi:MAG: SpoIIE family protein phosphatase [Kofleriaceae bacterium]
MQDLWSSASYEPHLLSLAFALAPAALLIVIAYAAVMRGAPALRGWLLGHGTALLPYAVVVTLSPSITSPALAEQLFRIAAAFIPVAAACGTGFQLALIRVRPGRRWLAWPALASAAIWIPISTSGGAAIDGVAWNGALWFPVAGPWAWLALVHTVAISAPGFAALGWVALSSRPSEERRQLRAALLANLVTYAGLVDVALAYGIGVFPLGWLLSGIGSLLVVRALVVEDLLRVRAVDTTAPVLVVHFAGAVLLSWITLAQLGAHPPWWAALLALVLSFAGVRTSIATLGLIVRGARTDGPLDRLLADLVGRARGSTSAAAIGRLAADVIALGVGVRPIVVLEDLGGAEAPIARAWLLELRGLAFADELDAVPAELRAPIRALFERHGARAIAPIRGGDELLGLVIVPSGPRRLRGPALAFVERATERLAEALLHARMARRAAERAAIAREVELAATVQADLLPGKGPHQLGQVTVVGSWRPATRCAGDFWAVHPLGDGRVLIAIGDVTGHGVASAMVTAAAAGACEVFVRRAGPALELGALIGALDVAVRRVGGGALAMTCFAAILDPAARRIRYASCGHTAPYLCRTSPGDVGEAGAARVELHALVGRGNPLGSGAGTAAVPRVVERILEAGDLVVCYTDGVTEAQDPAGVAFGDRRFQHLLRRMSPRLAPLVVHDAVEAAIAAHRAGRPLADDQTVVVAQWTGLPERSAECAA